MIWRPFVLFLAVFGFSVGSNQWLVAQEDEAIAEAVVEAAPISAEGDEVAKVEEAKAPNAKLRPLTVSIGLIEDTLLTGTLIDSTAIGIKTAFGEASIPLSEVAGIRFPTVEDTSTTIVMLNGDSITGATDLKFVSIETTWGSAKINGQNIATMQFVPGLTWKSSESLGGKRWTLTEAAQPVNNQVQQASATTSPQPTVNQPTQGRVIQGSPQIIYGRQ